MKNNSSSKAGIIIGTLIISIALFSGLGFLLVSKNIIVLNNAQVENAYIDAGTFNVQLTDTDRKRYFQGRVYVGYDKDNDDYKEKLVKEKGIAVASEAINTYLQNQSYDYLDDVSNIDEIRNTLKDEINKQLQTCKIRDVRFYSYLLQ